MCGIIGGISKQNIVPTLIIGLERLEYRGYDSAGLAIINDNKITRKRAVGKVVNLKNCINGITGNIGIAHTRWATHGAPSVKNAHPHTCNNSIAIVHNGIIENFVEIKSKQQKLGYAFSSDTDTETIVNEIFHNSKNNDLLAATKTTIKNLKGAYALGIIANDNSRLIAARKGSPLVIGISNDGNFIASDIMALIHLTNKFIYLEDGDIANIELNNIEIYDKNNKLVKREITISSLNISQTSIGNYQHFMQKEIFEQPQAVSDTLEGRISDDSVLIDSFGFNAKQIFTAAKRIQIIACGTSYNAGLVAKYWLEDIAKIPTNIEVASEYRYRKPLILNNILFIFISQSGETADTLEALKLVKNLSNNKILTICNTAESSMTRIADLVFLTHAGIEIGVASTKAFTTQLVALALFTMAIGKCHCNIDKKREKTIVLGLKKLPKLLIKTLEQEQQIKELAQDLGDKFNAIFLGRGVMHAIAMEGALKLKEISYIHAEAYPAGELKHGPIALIDKKTPVIAIAPDDELLDKLKSNLQEVKSRGSEMIVFADENANIPKADNMKIVPIVSNLGRITSPIIFTIPLQLLSYHSALIKGTDVDKPRNLAKSVTVE